MGAKVAREKVEVVASGVAVQLEKYRLSNAEVDRHEYV